MSNDYDRFFESFFLAVSTLLNKMEINSSVSFNNGSILSGGDTNPARVITFSHTSVSRSSFNAIFTLWTKSSRDSALWASP